LTQQHIQIGLKYACMEMPSEKTHTQTSWFCSTHIIIQPMPHSNAEMERVFSQINFVKLNLKNKMSAEQVG